MTTDNTYKVIELVGSSSQGVQQAIDGAIARAGETIRNLDWFEVKEIRGNIQDVGGRGTKPKWPSASGYSAQRTFTRNNPEPPKLRLP